MEIYKVKVFNKSLDEYESEKVFTTYEEADQERNALTQLFKGYPCGCVHFVRLDHYIDGERQNILSL